MEEILFQITKDQLETGLRGFPVGYCTTSYVDPQKGLFYVGKELSQLSHRSPEEVIYLLHQGKEATPQELAAFSQELKRRGHCAPQVIEGIYKLPRTGHPMKHLCTGLLLLGMFETTGNYREDALNLVAKIPHLTAAVINHHAGWGETPPSKPELGYMENFVYLLKCPSKQEKDLVAAFKLFDVLHFDHGGGNLSTFVGKAVASSLEDMYGSMCAALCGLAGPLHGKANQDCLEFVQAVLREVGPQATPSQVEDLLRKRLENKQLVFGFGHAVLRVEDPRATVLYEYAHKHFPEHPLVKIALFLRTEGAKVLKENPKISDPYPNVDAISGTVLSAAGFPYPEYFTVLFGMSRCVGISAQIVYERLEARGGKGTPIVRPKYFYKSRK